MPNVNVNRAGKAEMADSNPKLLYKLGGAAALIMVVIIIIQFIVFGAWPPPLEGSVADWFKLFQDNWLLGLRMLGLINIISLTVTIPLYFALFASHRNMYKAYAALAMIIYLVGVAIYISNNAAVPMSVLSSKYLAATSDAQITLLAAAGEAIIVKGADFTPGSFIGFFFTELAGIAFSLIMLRGRIFNKAAAYSGFLGFICLAVFTVLITLVPALYDASMIIAMIGGLLCMVWYILTGRRLIKLESNQTVKINAF